MQTTILFDLDGTLIDSTEAILNSFNFAFLDNKNKNYDEKKIKALIGISLDEIFKACAVDDVDKYISSYKKQYEKVYLEQSFLLPLVKEALSEAKSFAKLGVVTNKGGFFTAKLLKHLGIFDFFGTIITKDDVSKAKPDAEPINKALETLKQEKENAYLVGDTSIDAKAAKNANIKCVAVEPMYESKEELAKSGVFIAKNVLEAVLHIKNLEAKWVL